MASASLKVEGVNEAVRAMVRAGVDVDDLKSTFREVGDQVSRRAKAAAPKDTGKMAGSVRSSNRRNATIISVGNNSSIGYAQYPIFGTKYQSGFNFVLFAAEAVDSAGIIQRGVNSALTRAGF